jgi:hypothetical protein
MGETAFFAAIGKRTKAIHARFEDKDRVHAYTFFIIIVIDQNTFFNFCFIKKTGIMSTEQEGL